MKKKTINLNGKEIDIYIDEDNTVYLSQYSLAILYQKSQSTIKRVIQKLSVEKHEKSEERTSNDLPDDLTNMYVVSSHNTYLFNSKILRFLDDYWNQNNTSLLSSYLSKSNDKENEQISDIIDDFDNKVITFDNGIISIDVNVSPKEETVWLSLNQIVELFETTKQLVSYHIKNIIEEGELENSVVKENLTTEIADKNSLKTASFLKECLCVAKDGKTYLTTLYNLDMVLAIGYRIKSKRAIEFRRWASSIIKNYLIKGYAINEDRITKIKYEIKEELRYEIQKLKEKIEEELFVQPIKEKLFVSGQCYDSYEFLSNIVKNVKEEIILVDSYLDTIGLSVLKNITNLEVKRIIFISTRATLQKESLEEFKNQYKNVEIYYRDDIHDRFILIDNSMLYVIGTSVNRYMGNKVFYVHTSDDKKTIINLREELFKKISPYCGEYTKK